MAHSAFFVRWLPAVRGYLSLYRNSWLSGVVETLEERSEVAMSRAVYATYWRRRSMAASVAIVVCACSEGSLLRAVRMDASVQRA